MMTSLLASTRLSSLRSFCHGCSPPYPFPFIISNLAPKVKCTLSILPVGKLEKRQHLPSQVVNWDSFNLAFLTPFKLYHPILKPPLAQTTLIGMPNKSRR